MAAFAKWLGKGFETALSRAGGRQKVGKERIKLVGGQGQDYKGTFYPLGLPPSCLKKISGQSG